MLVQFLMGFLYANREWWNAYSVAVIHLSSDSALSDALQFYRFTQPAPELATSGIILSKELVKDFKSFLPALKVTAVGIFTKKYDAQSMV